MYNVVLKVYNKYTLFY